MAGLGRQYCADILKERMRTVPFHENLVRLRKQAGMSQEDLAEKLQLTRQTISKWETGLSEPDLSRIKELCNLLGASTNELLFGEEDREKKEERKEKQSIYEVFCYIFLIVVFVSAVFVLNSPRSVLDRQEFAMRVMNTCIILFLVIGVIKGCLQLFAKKERENK